MIDPELLTENERAIYSRHNTGITFPDCVDVRVLLETLCAEREKAKRLPAPDDPEWDATDFAHPAWWRGHVHGVTGAAAVIRAALDGKDDGHGTIGDPELERARREVMALRTALADALLAAQWAMDALPEWGTLAPGYCDYCQRSEERGHDPRGCELVERRAALAKLTDGE